MKLEFPSKGIALISLIEANFSLNQCIKILGMDTTKQASVLAAATRRRGHEPMEIPEDAVTKLEERFGLRAGKKQGKGYSFTIEL